LVSGTSGFDLTAWGIDSWGIWERDLKNQGVDQQTSDKLRKGPPDIAMAYHEVLKPETFADCCRRIQAGTGADDVELVEDMVVGAMAYILYNLANKPEKYHFDNPEDVHKFISRVISNLRMEVIGIITKLPQQTVSLDTVPARVLETIMEQQEEYLSLEVRQVLSVLPLKYRHPVVLRLRGYQIKEIAKFFGTTSSAVKTSLHRARQMIAEPDKSGG